MNKENMKNMVVLKDLPSNLVEEAIVIFKPNVKINSLNIKNHKNSKKNNEQDSKKYIVTEAQMVISNYLSTIEKQKKKSFNANKKIENKYRRARIVCTCLIVALIISLIV